MKWLPTDYALIINWLSIDSPLIMNWLLIACQLIINWLSNNWLWSDYQLVIQCLHCLHAMENSGFDEENTAPPKLPKILVIWPSFSQDCQLHLKYVHFAMENAGFGDDFGVPTHLTQKHTTSLSSCNAK